MAGETIVNDNRFSFNNIWAYLTDDKYGKTGL